MLNPLPIVSGEIWCAHAHIYGQQLGQRGNGDRCMGFVEALWAMILLAAEREFEMTMVPYWIFGFILREHHLIANSTMFPSIMK